MSKVAVYKTAFALIHSPLCPEHNATIVDIQCYIDCVYNLLYLKSLIKVLYFLPVRILLLN